MKHLGFQPVFDKDCKILILGSFPSVKSREVGFYYGNKLNRFWKMLEDVFEEKIGQTKEEKIAFLKKHHIALWDVVQTSDIEGSADISLEKSNIETANFSFLLPPNTKVEKILCNGKTAYTLFQKICKTNIPVLCMTSTSSANPRFDFEQWKSALISK